MNLPLLRHTWRTNAFRLAIVAIALAIWGSLMPIIYATFGQEIKAILGSGIFPVQFAQFGGGDMLSLAGTIAIGFIHPFAVALVAIFAVGFGAVAVAGERQRGTLEILLSRPISRRRAYVTLLTALIVFVAVCVAAEVLGAIAGAMLFGVGSELALERVPLLWLNGVLFYVALGAIALAASVSFDRVAPAVGVTLAIMLTTYFLEVIGSIWPDAAWLQPYSLFHYLTTRAILTGRFDPVNLGVLAGVALCAITYALVVFPRRDLAAPS